MTQGIYRWIIGATCLLLIFAGVCYWYYQQTTAQYKQEADEAEKLLEKWKANKANQTTAADKV